MGEIEQLAIERGRARVVVFEFTPPQGEFGLKPAQARVPALASADHRRVNQQAFPAPWRTGGAVGDRRGGGRRGIALAGGGLRDSALRDTGLQELRIGRHEFARRRRRSRRRRIRFRQLRERQIFGEAAGRETLGGASEQRQQGAAARFGADRAAGELGRDSRAGQRFFEIRRIARRRVEQDGDPIERDAAFGFELDPSGDLDAFLHLAGRRAERYGIIEWCGRGGDRGEEIFLHPGERIRVRRGLIRCGPRGWLGCDAQGRAEEFEAAGVTGRHRGEQVGRAPGQRGNQVAVEYAADREVEQEGRESGEARRDGGLQSPDRGLEDARAVNQVRGMELLVEMGEDGGQRETDFAELRDLRRLDQGVAQVGVRRGERAGQTGQFDHFAERREPRVAPETKEGACRHGLRAELVHIGKPLRRGIFRREQPGQPVEGQTMKREDRAALEREPAHEVVGGLRAGRDNQGFGARRKSGKPGSRDRETFGGARRNDDSPSGHCPTTPGTIMAGIVPRATFLRQEGGARAINRRG